MEGGKKDLIAAKNGLKAGEIHNIINYLEYCGVNTSCFSSMIEQYKYNCLINKDFKESGIDIFRNFEYTLSLDFLDVNSGDKILDIGSRDSFYPSFLVKKFDCVVYATDIDRNLLNKQVDILKKTKQIDMFNSKFYIKVEDATKLTFPDNFFDNITAISAIVHIEGRGDIKAMNEFYRILKPRGHLILTVPAGPVYCEKNTEYYGYEKRYNLHAINERLINKNKFDTEKIIFLKNKSEKGNIFAEFWYQHELYAILGKFSPFFSFGLYEISEKFDDRVIGSIIYLTKKDTK